MRLRIDLAYDGTDFSGWATQPSLRTVQGTLEAALATALRVPEARVVCAGRTDAGVHARGQVVHLDLAAEDLAASAGRSTDPAERALLRRLNGILPPDIRVRAVAEAPAGFDARFSAVWRRYAYRLVDNDAALDPLTRHHVLPWRAPLDVEAMNTASFAMLGLQEFAAFCKPREGATTVRTLTEFAWHRDEDGVVTARVVADAFCHHMVRSLVGCLLAVGDGRRSPGWAVETLASRVRDGRVAMVPPHGLTLEEVGYPEDLAAQATRARARREAL